VSADETRHAAPAVAAQRARGSALQSTLDFLDGTFGHGLAGRVIAALSRDDQTRIATVTPTDEVPYLLLVRLWDAAAAQLEAEQAAERATWAERAGEASIGSFGVQLYGGILRKPTPHEFLTQSISLFRLYYQPGDMTVVEEEATRTVLRLVGFDPVTRAFCRRQTGGLHRAITLAGGQAAQVEHVRCLLEGDAFCEWELTWTGEAANGMPAVGAGAGPSP